MIMTVPYDKHSEFDNCALAFSGLVYVYTTVVDDVDLLRTSLEGDQMKMALRDDDYRAAKQAHSKPDVFICHDSRDKDSFVRPLAESLQNLFVKVWYDDFSLSIGDSIIEKLDEGLHSCRFATVILSPNFLSRKKWSYREFKSLTSREIEGGQKILLPIWLNVTRRDVEAYSLDLADKYALDASIGYEKLAQAIKAEIAKRDRP